MKPEKLIEILSVAEKLKCITRHADTSSKRRESVAEHSWRIALMAMLVADEFPETDINKVIKMCLIHDLGEAFLGDIPTFEKSKQDSILEEEYYKNWIADFPTTQRLEFEELLREMKEMQTEEAKLYKALDKMEAVIQHNEGDISTWLPLEYELQLVYGSQEVEFSPYLKELKAYINQMTREKIEKEGNRKEL